MYLLESSSGSRSSDSLYCGTANRNSSVQIVSSSNESVKVAREMGLEHVPVKRVYVGLDATNYRRDLMGVLLSKNKES